MIPPRVTRPRGMATVAAVTRIAAVLSAALVATLPGTSRAQAIDALPAPDAVPSAAPTTWVADAVEAPEEIAFGTMEVNVWVRLHRAGGDAPLASLVLVTKGKDGEDRVPMRAVDGAFDSGTEDAVATVETYAWVRAETHAWEVWARTEGAAPRLVTKGKLRVKPRVATPDLVVVDERGLATAWIGSGAGGFVAGAPVDCGIPLAPPAVRPAPGEVGTEVLVPALDGALRVLTTGRSGRLEAGRLVGCGAGLTTAALGDLDGDGRTDLVTAGSRRLDIRLDLDDLPTQTLDLPLEPELVALADLDGDGKEEIYVALLDLTDERIGVLTPTGPDATEWGLHGFLSPPEGGRGRLRALVPLPPAGGGAPRALLVLSEGDGEAVLESRRSPADTESVYHPAAPRVRSLPGEPLGAVAGRFSDPASPSWLVWIRQPDHVEWWEVPLRGAPFLRGRLESEPAAVVALDLDGDGDDDLATGGGELRLWINVRGADFREAGESPYPLEARVVALAAGRLDE